MADLAHPKLAIFRRRVFTTLSVVSMVLCFAVLILWWRSYSVYEELLYGQVNVGTLHLVSADSLGGYLSFNIKQLPLSSNSNKWPTWTYYRYPQIGGSIVSLVTSEPNNSWLRWIFGYQKASSTVLPRGIAIRHWLFALAFAVLPAMYIRTVLRTRRRHRIGLCSACGYDLRASPGRCPECGAIGGRPEDSGRAV